MKPDRAGVRQGQFIQPYSGHTTRTSLEIYSKIALSQAQDAYDNVIGTFPV